jgi:hypothetical protein
MIMCQVMHGHAPSCVIGGFRTLGGNNTASLTSGFFVTAGTVAGDGKAKVREVGGTGSPACACGCRVMQRSTQTHNAPCTLPPSPRCAGVLKIPHGCQHAAATHSRASAPSWQGGGMGQRLRHGGAATAVCGSQRLCRPEQVGGHGRKAAHAAATAIRWPQQQGAWHGLHGPGQPVAGSAAQQQRRGPGPPAAQQRCA